jgi:oligoendopeptidase F
MALSEAVLAEGAPARERFLGFLGSGSSRFPLDTLRAAGVDLSSPEPVLAALKAFDGLVARMEDIYGG